MFPGYQNGYDFAPDDYYDDDDDDYDDDDDDDDDFLPSNRFHNKITSWGGLGEFLK